MTDEVTGAMSLPKQAPSGIASTVATERLLAEIRTRVREGGQVVWLDVEGQYTRTVDALDEHFPYPIVRLRGSYLQLMLDLEPYGNGLRPEHVLVHLSGLNKDSVRNRRTETGATRRTTVADQSDISVRWRIGAIERGHEQPVAATVKRRLTARGYAEGGCRGACALS